jgi:hypothetical protein
MTINVTNRDTGKPVFCGDTIMGMYGEPWIYLALASPTTVWVRDPITGNVVDFDPATMVINVDIRG